MNYLRKTNYLYILFLAACFPKEEAVSPIPRINASVSLDAGEYKNTVVFYSLDSSKVVAQASPMSWDFYVDEEVIRLNYFRSMRVAIFDGAWDKLADTSGLKFKYLTHDNEDTLEQWEMAENQVYVVDYGLDNEFNPIGLISVRFERSRNGLKIAYKHLGELELQQILVDKSSFYYNLRTQTILDLPTEREYDLAFGRYTDLVTLDNITQEYTIYGVIQGRASAYAENKSFDEIGEANFETMKLSYHKTVIGWDWKNFNLSKNAFEILENRTYLVQSNAQFEFKLRFVNFYNSLGQSGHPTFEWQLL